MKNVNAHPARSADFLSRLHDGELTAAERAHFETHRAHCADCRRASREFEAALSLFRASTTSPPPPDLSARVLRRLQAASPRRPPFGVIFGINLKWASAFAVALLATIVGSLAVIQRESARKVAARETPIPVLLQKGEKRAETSSAPEAAAAPSRKTNNAPPRREAAPTAVPEQGRYAESPPPRAPAPSEEKAPPPARRPAEPSSPRAARAADSAAPLLLRKAEPLGGEGGLSAAAASAEPGAPARLVLTSLDGQGGAPEIITPGASELLADLRGRQYFLLVEASGHVREVRPDGKRERKQAMSRDALEEAVPQAVRDLRFQATDRPRRLLLKIE